MRLSDLSRKDKSDATARWLGGVERNESISRIHQPRPGIFNLNNQLLGPRGPGKNNRRFSIAKFRTIRPGRIFKHRLSCIAKQIDEHLLELVGIN